MSDSNSTKYYDTKTFMKTSISYAAEKKEISIYQNIHRHEFYELEYILAGEGEQVINGVSYKFKRNYIFLTTPTDFHEVDFYNKTKLINIQFTSEIINPEIFSYISGPFVFEDTDLSFYNYFAVLNEYSPLSRKHNKILFKYMLNSCLFLLVTQNKAMEGKFLYSINNYYHCTLTYIYNNFSKEITLKELAKAVNLTPEYLCKLFKKHNGQTINQYISDVRLRYASNLITNTEMTISDIAQKSGYNDVPHFTRAFKKKFNESPREMRKKHKA